MRYAKAIAGALVAALLVLKTAVGDDHVTTAEWIEAGIQFLVVGGGVWAIPNVDPYEPQHD